MKSGTVLLILVVMIGGGLLYVRKYHPDLWAKILSLFTRELTLEEELPEAGVTGRPYIPGIDPYSGLPLWWGGSPVTGRPFIPGIDPYSGLPIKKGGIPIAL